MGQHHAAGQNRVPRATSFWKRPLPRAHSSMGPRSHSPSRRPTEMGPFTATGGPGPWGSGSSTGRGVGRGAGAVPGDMQPPGEAAEQRPWAKAGSAPHAQPRCAKAPREEGCTCEACGYAPAWEGQNATLFRPELQRGVLERSTQNAQQGQGRGRVGSGQWRGRGRCRAGAGAGQGQRRGVVGAGQR